MISVKRGECAICEPLVTTGGSIKAYISSYFCTIYLYIYITFPIKSSRVFRKNNEEMAKNDHRWE